MAGSESDKPTKEKETKPAAPSTAQEPSATTTTPTTPMINPDWSGFQAYSPIPPPGFLASSPHGQPYMWGVQHIMPPYGTPPHPYVAMYPHGGIYAHPSIPPGSYPFSPFAMPYPNGIVETNTPGLTEAETKQTEAKEKLPIKRSKGSLGSLSMITGKNNDQGKTSGTPANGVHSKSADTGSEGSSEGSDENSPNESQPKSGGRQDSMEEVSQNGSAEHGHQNGGSSTPQGTTNQSMAVLPFPATGGVTGPATNLNIGMDYWGTPAAPVIPAMRGKVPVTPVTTGMVSSSSRDNMQSHMWLQDERELKRQKRKQSNRESARRSRLRKQAECDELAHRAEALKEENASLRAEVARIRGEYERLLGEHASLKEKLEISGQDNGSSGEQPTDDSSLHTAKKQNENGQSAP
ncbi:hypothetical protein MLD38_018305 [Melastoma candidum]|uniref:Uncharacterized protein n=1 Tax=Melastoma candidum TaxID=119954 RepID=A0ACB9QVC9_9MYRT|nr:hypothetical protein MLD38_018305 [Melastoma candidum]